MTAKRKEKGRILLPPGGRKIRRLLAGEGKGPGGWGSTLCTPIWMAAQAAIFVLSQGIYKYGAVGRYIGIKPPAIAPTAGRISIQ